jgi:hypothetical protein
MPILRRLTLLALALSSASATQAQTKSTTRDPGAQSPVGLQGSLGFGGGEILGVNAIATLGPRIHNHLISIRGVWGFGTFDSLGRKRHPVTELALLYGRRFCTPGACYSFGIGPGAVNQLVHTPQGVWQRQYNGGLSFQLSLQGTITPTSTIGLTFIGNRNAVNNFWGLSAGVQFGMPRQRMEESDDE